MLISKQIYSKAIELVDKYSLADATHQRDHTERVLRLIDYLAKQENLPSNFDLESLKLAAIFHDLGSIKRIKKLRKSTDKAKSEEHSQQGFKIAKKFLHQEGVPLEQIEKIYTIINSHGSRGINGNIEGDLLHDADLLDGIGLVGVTRIFAFGGQINRGVIDTFEFIKNKINNRQFRTKSGQKLGQKRIKEVRKWLEKIDKEIHSRDLI